MSISIPIEQSSKVFIEDLEEIELTLSLSDSSTSVSPIIRLHIESGNTFVFHDQVTMSNSNMGGSHKMFITNLTNTAFNLKFEAAIISSGNLQSLGEASITLANLLDSPKRCLTLKINQDIELTVSWAPPERSPLNVYITVESLGLKFTNSWFRRVDAKPYFKLVRCVTGAEDVVIYTSETVNAKGFNTWNQFKVKASELCKGDKWNPIKTIVCYKSGSVEKALGEGMFSLEQLLSYHNTVTLADQSRQRCVGSLRVLCEVSSIYSFNDYVKAGLKFNSMLAIDFSDSQYKLSRLPSNHFAKNDKSFTNDYQKVMTDLWPFLAQANSSSKIPVYGLGGVKKNQEERGVGSCFDILQEKTSDTPIRKRSQDIMAGPWISSLNDLMIAYENMVINAKLGGKCRMTSVIEKAKYLAKFNTLYRNQEYVMLTIITDGHIEDLDSAIRSLKGAQNLPLSVIFIGVGDGDFSDLAHLERSVESQGQRSCVTFMKYSGAKEPTPLVKTIIKEVPKHIREFIDNEREENMANRDDVLDTENYVEETIPSGRQEDRETVLKRKIPPMMKDWICENNKKEFIKAKEMIDKMTGIFKISKTYA